MPRSALPSFPRRSLMLGGAALALPLPAPAQRVQPANRVTPAAISVLTGAIYAHCQQYANAGGTLRIEDGLGACAALVGEACLVVAMQLDFDTGRFANPVRRVTTAQINPGPDSIAIGQPVFAERIDGFLLQANSTLRYALPFRPDEFPAPEDVFRFVAANVAAAEPGWVALSVPKANWPQRMPLKEAYELRPRLHEIMRAAGADAMGYDRINLCASALAQTFGVSVNFDPKTMLLMAYETMFGMARMVPAIGPQWRPPGTVLGPA